MSKTVQQSQYVFTPAQEDALAEWVVVAFSTAGIALAYILPHCDVLGWSNWAPVYAAPGEALALFFLYRRLRDMTGSENALEISKYVFGLFFIGAVSNTLGNFVDPTLGILVGAGFGVTLVYALTLRSIEIAREQYHSYLYVRAVHENNKGMQQQILAIFPHFKQIHQAALDPVRLPEVTKKYPEFGFLAKSKPVKQPPPPQQQRTPRPKLDQINPPKLKRSSSCTGVIL